MGKRIDLTGLKFGKLTVLNYDHSDARYKSYWLCQCDCGNKCVVSGDHLKTGHTTSCGCNRHEDLTNQRFGKLTALHYAYTKNKKVYWHCKCDCGNELDVQANSLKTGNTTSCGCIRYGSNTKDIIGKRFGKLTVIKWDHSDENTSYWLCQCDCGNKCVVEKQHLQKGHTQSCGCIRSQAELFIREWLVAHQIVFKTEYHFEDLKDIQYLRFDFCILEKNNIKLIEFDGIQHFQSFNGWGGEEKLAICQKHDCMKNNYCIQHDIPLLRLKYTDSKEQIIKKIKKFLDIK